MWKTFTIKSNYLTSEVNPSKRLVLSIILYLHILSVNLLIFLNALKIHTNEIL